MIIIIIKERKRLKISTRTKFIRQLSSWNVPCISRSHDIVCVFLFKRFSSHGIIKLHILISRKRFFDFSIRDVEQTKNLNTKKGGGEEIYSKYSYLFVLWITMLYYLIISMLSRSMVFRNSKNCVGHHHISIYERFPEITLIFRLHNFYFEISYKIIIKKTRVELWNSAIQWHKEL